MLGAWVPEGHIPAWVTIRRILFTLFYIYLFYICTFFLSGRLHRLIYIRVGGS